MSTPVGPYTPILPAGQWRVASGQVGIVDGALVDDTLAGQFAQALANLKSVLESGGAQLNDVIKTTIFLVSMDDYAEMNAIYIDFFGDHRPARSAVAVAELPLGARVEIEAWAYLADG